MHVAHEAELIERARLVRQPPVAPARRTTRRSGAIAARGDPDRDVLEVVVGDRGERERAVEGQPPSSDGSAPRPMTTGSPSSRAMPTFSPSSRSSTATTATPHRAAAGTAQPDLPEPDDDDVVATRHRAATDEAGEPRPIEAVHQARGERRLEDERDEHARRMRP